MEITVHTIETIQKIEIKIIKVETVQGLVETEAVQDIGKEETQKDSKDIKDHTKRSIIIEKTRSIIMTKVLTVEAGVEKD